MSSILSGQPTDILHYLFTYLDQDTVIQVWQVSRRFKHIIADRVPLTFTIKGAGRGLRLVSLFKKVRLEAPYGHSLDDTDYKKLGKYLTTLNLLDNRGVLLLGVHLYDVVPAGPVVYLIMIVS